MSGEFLGGLIPGSSGVTLQATGGMVHLGNHASGKDGQNHLRRREDKKKFLALILFRKVPLLVVKRTKIQRIKINTWKRKRRKFSPLLRLRKKKKIRACWWQRQRKAMRKNIAGAVPGRQGCQQRRSCRGHKEEKLD